ncbi:MAG: hypothetical protein AAB035_03940 [Nitrospirota bacterium]
MSKQSKWDYFKAIYSRYKTADTANKKAILAIQRRLPHCSRSKRL